MHGHSHSAHDHHDAHDGPNFASPSVIKAVNGAVVVCAVLAVLGLVVLWPGGGKSVLPGDVGFADQVNGRVVSTRVGVCSFSSADQPDNCHMSTIVITSGPTKGDVTQLETPVEGGTLRLENGDRIVLNYVPDVPPGAQYQFADFQRTSPLLFLTLLFAAAVVLLGRLRGFLALGGLVVSFLVLAWFMLPALLEGSSPLAVALAGGAVIALAALYLAHGFNERTSVAVLGTFASLALTGALGWAFVAGCNFTGLAQEDAGYLRVFAGALDFKGLLLAGIVIGSLGVLDDVTVTQVSAVWELRQADPTMPAPQLYRSALRIGRDHIASTVNTLVLAYAGASLPLLLLITKTERPLGNVIGSETVAVEIVRTLVGSIGLVASVPITTALGVIVVAGWWRPALVSTRRRPEPRGRARPVAERPERPERPEPPQPPERPPSWDDFAPREETEA